jgi:hypothetical protein
MQCKACRFEDEKRKKNFLEIEGLFFVVRKNSGSKRIGVKGPSSDRCARVYACPKCGTLVLSSYLVEGVI